MDLVKKKDVGRMMKSVSSKTKGESTMSKKIIGLVAVGMLFVGSAFAATNQNVVLTITPDVGTVAITVDDASILFGTVGVSKSSAPAQKVVITNASAGGISITKQVTSISGAGQAWTLAKSTGVQDECTVNCFEANAEPGQWNGDWDAILGTDYDDEISSFTVGEVNPLCITGGSQTTIEPTYGATVWFRIAVPNLITDNGLQTITVNFVGAAN